MKCPHCNGEHPDNYQFCPITGQRIEPQFKACTNEDCPDFGKHILPLEAKFCPCCGRPIQESAGCSQIVVVCSKAGSSIQIGRLTFEEGLIREKRIRLKKGENVISVEEYPELQYGFSFSIKSKAEQIEDIILDGFDTSKITSMYQMFYGCSSLVSLNLSGFDTSSVTNMRSMFHGCSSLESLDLSGFDTSQVKDMSCMFEDCSSLVSLGLNGFDTSNVTDMSHMFCGCSSLESLDLSEFDTFNVTYMYSMFYDCSSLVSLDLSEFDTSVVTSMQHMFYGCSSLVSLDLSGFDTSNVTNMDYMFNKCSSLVSLDLSGFDKIFYWSHMFDGCSENIQKKYEYPL
ncbi:BspA family leucine-rich repeat surface protein [Marseilla massiliensis]|uniref:BspA family leucine-rich repeat surface protein n=1 Tax=Marseilla massiliensis TaxID=1841864 RepID=A0A939B7Q3_9BACT|nr:BspA family leucine-rich repeat surface protein [Marseilla massiliensis]MBM6673797.1 BspA family leucine-rich repeat surface protein [Marseilla massiliensis]